MGPPAHQTQIYFRCSKCLGHLLDIRRSVVEDAARRVMLMTYMEAKQPIGPIKHARTHVLFVHLFV